MAATQAEPAITLREIQSVVEDDLKAFQRKFREAVRVRHGLLDRIVQYVLRQKGKRIRPTLVLLSAHLCGGVTERSYRAATLVELLHTATLVHDDVVDESEKRRGAFSINALWGNKVAVLVGDYFLSRGLLLALEHNDFDLLKTLSDAVQRMSEGELLQVERTRRLDLNEETYYRIISDKTASLIAACTRCGAYSTGASAEVVNRMGEIGEQLGLAFQIRDDLFDYGTGNVGKPVGADLKKKLVTLPLIHALRSAEPAERRSILQIVRRRKKSVKDRTRVCSFVEAAGGLAYARGRMEAHITEVQALLHTFPDCPARQSLTALSRYIIARKK